VLFYEDFSGDEVGNFPRRLQLVGGNMEIAEWRGGRWLRSTGNGAFAIPLPEVLPQRFTMEMDVYNGARRNTWGEVTVRFSEKQGAATPVVQVNWTKGGLLAPGMEAMTNVGQQKFADEVVPVRVMADGQYVKVYMGDKRVANVPVAEIGRARKIWVTVPASDESPAYVGPIRVAAGGKKLYDALAASGRVATHGVLFDTGSDRLRPESTPTLKEISAMLGEHPELELTIEGHTDDAGDPAANQALSQRRAEAVKAYLVEHGADASRLSAAGFGAAKPVASNATAEGRQQNRRVELVKR
jgi:outer membrane protein OmpA-like peptidoglycan-associated protein